jgi:ATP-dependent DNA ligase
MAERGLKFHCFDAISYDEWHSRSGKETFEQRKARYETFGKNIGTKLYVAVEQSWCSAETEADDYYAKVKTQDGEGVMMRTPYGKYEPNTRSKDIVKRKIWHDCSARIVAIHQLACPLKYAEEVREVDGVPPLRDPFASQYRERRIDRG